MASAESATAANTNTYKVRQIHAENNKFDDLTLIWLDAHIDESNDCLQVKDRLRLIVNVLKTFDDIETCIAYITSLDDDEPICVVVSGPLSNALIPYIIDLSQLICMAVYCFNESLYRPIANEFADIPSKFVGIFMELDPLLEALNERAAILRSSLSLISSLAYEDDDRRQKSVKDLSHENAIFVWFQLLIHTIFRLPRTDMARRKMIGECERQYDGNSAQLAKIKQFKETYKPSDAVLWYTHDSFVYRIINRALRTQNIDIILKFYPFIADLHDQLTALHKDFLDARPPSVLKVYRGQKMHIDELKKITQNVGRLLSMNSFFSTGSDRELARHFAGEASQVNDRLVSILYEVYIDTKVHAAPFSNLGKYSHFPGEEEFLFSIGAIFRIESADEIIDHLGKVWLVRMRLVDERREQELNDLFEHLKSQIGETSSLLIVAGFLFQMDDIAGAERYYILLRDELLEDDPDQPIVLNNLGMIAHKTNRTQEALDLYEQALKRYAKDTVPRPYLTAMSYSNMASIYFANCDYERAEVEFRKVLELQESCLDSNNELFITTRNNLGSIFRQEGKLLEALEQYQKALTLCQCVFKTENHPTRGVTEGNLGDIYDALGRNREAIDCFERSLAIYKRCLPPGHYSLVSSHANLGHAYIEIGNYEAALNHLESALTIEKQAGHGSQNNPISLANILEGFSLIYLRQSKLTQALGYCNQTLKILPKGHPNRAFAYRQLGAIYRQMGIYQLARKAYQEAIIVNPNNEITLAENLHSLGLVQSDEGKHDEAIISYNRALEIRKRLLPPMHPAIGKLYNEIGGTFLSTGRLEEALEHFQKTKVIEDESLPEYHIERARTLNNIGVTLFKLDRPEEALPFVDKAVAIARNLLPDTNSLRIMFQTTADFVHKRVETGSSEGVQASVQ
ncbi:unnamed protein product [Rotaria magnacalcarata]|uniref:ADP ribosyltransferase domain-containing protein n=1 Tax=Rotaria magnacalcarata TaxID=392030 RepID=A0A816UBH5_9BILA|nr:unnamed protein product [Rotaria magnacalcarata]CAF3933202.1 unnamed protein product [Rotaria magnacalcarata]